MTKFGDTMVRYAVLYNPLSGKVKEETVRTQIEKLLAGDEKEYFDVTKIESAEEFYGKLPAETNILLVGGDGTLNRFLNDTKELEIKNSVYYYAAGNGNDFWNDLGRKPGDAPVCIDKYIKNLPEVTVNGKSYKFINGVGYGIDGYCCEVGDKLKAEGKKVDYTAIAIKGLLFHYKPKNATVTVDGVKGKFKKVWIAPTMIGRFYGGGMIPTPAQDRMNEEGKVSLCVMYGKGKIRTLMAFPSIFKGEHVKKTNMVGIFTGKEITVTFDKPTALQIDGETILNVTEYTVRAAAVAGAEKAA